MTKEELQSKIAVLERDKEKLSSNDEVARQELSKSLGSFEYDNSFGIKDKQLKTLTWFQIFKEIGILLAKQEKLNYINDFEQLFLDVNKVKNDIERLKKDGNKQGLPQ